MYMSFLSFTREIVGTQRKLNNELPEEKAARLFSGIYGELTFLRLHQSNPISRVALVVGIGLAFGRDLAKRGARTIDDLKKPEYHSILTLDQQVGLKYYEDLLERIPRNEVTELYNIGELAFPASYVEKTRKNTYRFLFLRTQFSRLVSENSSHLHRFLVPTAERSVCAAREVDPTLQVECMGSYRRGQPNSGDIDSESFLTPFFSISFEAQAYLTYSSRYERSYQRWQNSLRSDRQDVQDSQISKILHAHSLSE
jgi:hypothetical protein